MIAMIAEMTIMEGKKKKKRKKGALPRTSKLGTCPKGLDAHATM